jgi:hypothetical protein
MRTLFMMNFLKSNVDEYTFKSMCNWINKQNFDKIICIYDEHAKDFISNKGTLNLEEIEHNVENFYIRMGLSFYGLPEDNSLWEEKDYFEQIKNCKNQTLIHLPLEMGYFASMVDKYSDEEILSVLNVMINEKKYHSDDINISSLDKYEINKDIILDIQRESSGRGVFLPTILLDFMQNIDLKNDDCLIAGKEDEFRVREMKILLASQNIKSLIINDYTFEKFDNEK